MSWQVCALLGAFFGGLTAILAKVGVKDVDSNLATAIRTVVVIIFAWGIVIWQGTYRKIPMLESRSVWFLIFSGFATGASWLFYYRALQLADATRVAPIDKLSLAFTFVLAVIFLHETVDIWAVLGALLTIAGVYLLSMPRQHGP